MEKITDMLTSPVWWVTVVVAGIGINLISAYLKTPLDARLTRLSRWWRERSEKRKAEFEADVARVSGNPMALTVACYNGLRQRLYVAIYLLFGTLFMLLTQTPLLYMTPSALRIALMFISAFVIFRASVCLLRAMNIHETIRRSQEERPQAEQSPAPYSSPAAGSESGEA